MLAYDAALPRETPRAPRIYFPARPGQHQHARQRDLPRRDNDEGIRHRQRHTGSSARPLARSPHGRRPGQQHTAQTPRWLPSSLLDIDRGELRHALRQAEHMPRPEIIDAFFNGITADGTVASAAARCTRTVTIFAAIFSRLMMAAAIFFTHTLLYAASLAQDDATEAVYFRPRHARRYLLFSIRDDGRGPFLFTLSRHIIQPQWQGQSFPLFRQADVRYTMHTPIAPSKETCHSGTRGAQYSRPLKVLTSSSSGFEFTLFIITITGDAAWCLYNKAAYAGISKRCFQVG